jgi:hypothetical protein
MRRPVTVLLGSQDSSPMTWGLIHPVLVLPQGAQDWPEERLRAVLLHEMAHVARGDWLTQFLARLTCALYWPLPPVWFLAHRMEQESERACDDRVLCAGVAPSDYAHALLEVVRMMRTNKAASSTAVAIVRRRAQVQDRLRQILAAGRNRRAASPPVIVTALLAAGGVLLLISALRPQAEAQSTSTASRLPETRPGIEEPSRARSSAVARPRGIRKRNIFAPGTVWHEVTRGDLAGVKRLVQANPQRANAQDKRGGNTPLNLAVAGGHLSIVRYLVSQGADVNGKDSRDNTPLHMAIVWGGGHKSRLQILDLLVAQGADVNARTRHGMTPLHYAVGFAGDPRVVQHLLAKGANPGARDNRGRSVLQQARQQGTPEMVRLLLEAGATE